MARSDAVDEANALLMGGGGASFAFDEIGDQVTGTIISIDSMQQTDFKTKEPLFWDDGRKKMQVRVGLQTDLTDWEGTSDPDDREDDDDGIRYVYLRYKSAEAVRKAVRAAKCKGIALGGKLRLRFDDKEKPRERGAQPTKLYVSRYKAPEVDLDDAVGDEPDEDTRPASKRRGRARDDDDDDDAPKGRSRRSRKSDDDDDDLDDDPPPRRGRSRAKDDDDDDEDKTPPKRSRSRRSKSDDDDDEPGF